MNNLTLAELEGVHKQFGTTVALDGLDLQVARGELLAVLGPNGAGKTTAISLLLGLQQPDRGAVRLFGQSPRLLQARRQMGVMMQDVALTGELRVRELIDLVTSYYPDPFSPDQVMELTRTTALAERFYGTLSGGQKRQAQFAIAACGRPKLLFLDEPTAGLDIQSREMMWTTLRQFVDGGSSIILTTHYLEEAEALATRVVVLVKGRVIASGSVGEMRGLVARKRISCRTTVPPEQVKCWPGVASVSCEQQRLQVVARDAEAVVRRLLVADENLSELEVSHAGLAEVFTELTQESVQ
jgi:ABC-2 type transport system ATP-binding protein